MSTPVDEAKVLVDALKAAGVKATHDPRKVAPPCVLIAPPIITFNSNCGGDAEWSAHVLAATGVGNLDAWTQLDQVVAQVLPILPAERAEPGSYEVDDNTAYPAYTLTWTSRVEFDTP